MGMRAVGEDRLGAIVRDLDGIGLIMALALSLVVQTSFII